MVNLFQFKIDKDDTDQFHSLARTRCRKLINRVCLYEPAAACPAAFFRFQIKELLSVMEQKLNPSPNANDNEVILVNFVRTIFQLSDKVKI